MMATLSDCTRQHCTRKKWLLEPPIRAIAHQHLGSSFVMHPCACTDWWLCYADNLDRSEFVDTPFMKEGWVYVDGNDAQGRSVVVSTASSCCCTALSCRLYPSVLRRSLCIHHQLHNAELLCRLMANTAALLLNAPAPDACTQAKVLPHWLIPRLGYKKCVR